MKYFKSQGTGYIPISLVSWMFSFFVVILAACSPVPQVFPTGEFVFSNGGVKDFNEDGTYSLSESDGKEPRAFGEYVIEGDVITMADNMFECRDAVGKYYWTVEKDRSLTFEVIEDECSRRVLALQKGLTYLRP